MKRRTFGRELGSPYGFSWKSSVAPSSSSCRRRRHTTNATAMRTSPTSGPTATTTRGQLIKVMSFERAPQWFAASQAISVTVYVAVKPDTAYVWVGEAAMDSVPSPNAHKCDVIGRAPSVRLRSVKRTVDPSTVTADAAVTFAESRIRLKSSIVARFCPTTTPDLDAPT